MARTLSRRPARSLAQTERVPLPGAATEQAAPLTNTLIQAALAGEQGGVAPLVAGAMMLESVGVPAMGQALSNSVVQRYMAMRHGQGAFAPEAGGQVRTALQRAGRPLPGELRGRLEQAFGEVSFAGVRVHTDSSAASAAEGIHAHAFTVGEHIFFGADAFHPESPEGRELLLHELTHVVQHQEGRIPSTGGAGDAGGMAVSAPSDSTEREAVATSAALAPALDQPLVDGAQAGLAALDAGLDVGSGADLGASQAGPEQAPGAASGLLSRQRDEAQISALIERIVQAIAEKETRRTTQESHLATSAGVKASYASQVQATTIWTIDAVRALPQADRDGMNLSTQDLNRLAGITQSTERLWRGVMGSGTQTQAELLASPGMQGHLTGSGLSETEDLPRMIAMRDLRAQMNRTYDARIAELDGLEATATSAPREQGQRPPAGGTRQPTSSAQGDPLQTWAQTLYGRASEWARRRASVRSVADLTHRTRGAGRRQNLRRFVAADEAATDGAGSGHNQTLAMDASSLRTYLTRDRIQGSPVWGEDRAGWQRRAAERDPAGLRLRDAATADNGLSLARSRIGSMVRRYLTTHPEASDEEVVQHAAGRHNPGEERYPADVLGNFHRLGAAREARGYLPRGVDFTPPSRSASFGLPAGVARALRGRLGSTAGVRVHTDTAAARFAASLRAEAVTVGQDLYFARGAYDPSTEEGLERIAHEVHHAILGGTRGVSQPGDTAERAAVDFAATALDPAVSQALGVLAGGEPAPAIATRLEAQRPGSGAALQGPAPEVSAPEPSLPEVSAAERGAPEVAPLALSAPAVSAPAVSAPLLGLPELGAEPAPQALSPGSAAPDLQSAPPGLP